ncbi:MAG TPA: tetratricopeptide repeat protein [Nitrospiraceae bacterium]|nr:tetratricopeptide repeat protein [Nitrospiraceae bacterium]
MELYWRLFCPSLFTLLLWVSPAFSASTKTVIADGQYVMADGDTLASAEEKVLQRAQRNAVEEAGIYLESTFLDVEKESGGRSTQTSSLEIRTIAAAVTETEILESRRSFELGRPVFFVRIRATVNMSSLAEAIRRLQSDQQLAQHFRQLQQENHQLRSQLQELQRQPVGVRMLAIDPSGKSASHQQRARAILETVFHTSNLRDKIQLSTDAAILDDRYVDPLIVRGQTYLRLVSLAFSQQAQALDYADYLDKAKVDFDRAIALDAKNVWAWVGKGDVLAWLKRLDEAAAAYEQALEIDPFADIARQPLIGVYTTQARRQADAKSWHQALATLKKLLNAQTPDSWIPYQKEAYALRSEIYLKLNQPDQAIEDLSTVIRVDPTNAAALVTRAKLYRERLQGRLAKDDLERACVLGSVSACEQLP